jgi:hypothetical protein
MAVAENGPRPAARTADEAAELIWNVLLDLFRRIEAMQRRSPGSTVLDLDEGRADGYIGALYLLTGEPHDSIRARARMVALAKTGDRPLF